MNQTALQGDNTWESDTNNDARATILQAWRESDDGPGQYLRKLRELQKKSVKEMASELGLSILHLSALENNNNEELPAPIYVKSYIKRYCACLGLDESEYQEMLDEASKAVLPTLNRVSLRRDAHSQHALMRWVGYAGVIALLAFLGMGITSVDFSGVWESFSSSSTGMESTATELSLPEFVEQPFVEEIESK